MVDVRETNLVDAETELNTAGSFDPSRAWFIVALARLSALPHTTFKGADDAFKTAVQLAPARSPDASHVC